MKYRNILKKRILAGLLAGVAACAAAPALAASGVVPNTQLPQGGNFVAGDGTIGDPFNGQMNITQNTQNGVIKWDGGFNIGANATVNFEGPQNGYNTLNYDASGNMSQIYGAINANNNGNIYIVNPAGVEISNSAQINVGSLYVSNKKMTDENLSDFQNKAGLDAIYNIQGETQDAVLMSLGNINATNVTFDGGRIVIDTERLKDVNGDAKLTKDKITVHTNNAANVVIGYDAYNEGDNKGTYKGKNKDATAFAQIWANGNKVEEGSLNAYMWVEDVEQLQAIKDNLDGNYALRNSIDATATQDWNDADSNTSVKEGFQSIGTTEAFTGKFDGLDYNIFNLNINRADETNVGLFGVVGDKAAINNVTLVGGSITGQNNVGALAGSVQGGAQISNITNSASVTGKYNVGGIVGESKGAAFTGLVNTGTIEAENSTDASNAGGLIGSMNGGTLGGASYNLGSVTGSGSNVGGLVGYAANAIIGNEGENAVTVYNRLNVTGAYNVGGIVGNMEDTTVQNAENSGNVKAKEHMDGNYYYHSDVGSAHIANASVWIANVGGIAGKASNSAFANVLNTGNVSSASNTLTENVTNVNGNGTKYVASTYYTAGNVGGIVGSAVDTNITNATNRENEIRGAHNVGGIAGYFTNSNDNDDAKKYTIKNGINDGGDIMATGARYKSNFVKETIRRSNGEHFTIGNMGGIVGYMDGDDVYIASSANRGTVHTLEPEDAQYVGSASQAANAGGIVGKIDRSDRKDIAELGANYADAAVSNSYNTGDVMGYTGIGGVAGMMYNGEIAGSYNLGNLRTTRQSRIGAAGSIDPINMGGIVGDTTEESSAQALLYDVYNKGQIGDANYDYFGRHVGGIVGRLSGAVEKAYNTGAIYNGYNVVGWMYTGSINNAFNTGNITVVNKNVGAASQVGGIVGAADVSIDDITLSNVYNLGTLRSFWENNDRKSHNSLGGIIGGVYKTYGDHNNKKDSVYIINAYTTGNLYIDDLKNSGMIGSIYTNENSGAHFVAENTYYIQPDTQLKDTFTNLYVEDNPDTDLDNSNKPIAFDQKDNIEQYAYEGHKLFQTETQVGNVNKADDWRIYKGSTPILNAFLPNAENYFSTTDGAMNGIASIQYGTAYDPLLTIVNAAQGTTNLEFNWQDLKINNDAGLAVYGAGLTLTDFKATGGSGYFGGLIYSEGALKLDGGTNDIHLGSASNLYGSSVSVNTEGDITSYGNIYATAADEKDENKGDVTIKGGEVNLYGKINFSRGQETSIPGIAAQEGHSTINEEEVKNPHFTMQTVGDRYAHNPHEGASTGDVYAGDVSITATEGDVNLYYGQGKDGLITADTLTVTAENGNIYSDSDLAVEGNITFTAPGEKVLDLTNIGKVRGEEFMDALDKALQEQGIDINNSGEINDNQSTVETVITNILEIYEPEHFKEGDDPDDKYKAYVKEIFNSLAGKDNKNLQWLEENAPLNLLHDFLHNFGKEKQHNITFAGSTDGKITIDMWDYDVNQFDLKKYDQEMSRGASHTLSSELSDMNIFVKEKPDVATQVNPQDYVYIWVSDGDQLKGIQQYYEKHENDPEGTNILSYNFALKNDIDASDVTDYEAIGTNSQNGYTGTFDGRDNRIIGLDTTKRTDGKTLTNAGIFDTIGRVENADGLQVGTVEDLRVYSGTFTGTANAGAVAGVNNGSISNVTAFGNVVQSEGYAGGITGENTGTIDNASAIGTATAANAEDESRTPATAGGIAGINQNGAEIKNSTSNSAVNASKGNAAALGGVAGVNAGTLTNVDSLGVTTGIYQVGEHNPDVGTQYSNNVGGIAGINQAGGTVESAYNESIVSGRDNVGGILGKNSGTNVSNVANASNVTGEAGNGETSDFVGGLVGDNEGNIDNGRNNGEITGNRYVGGLVGENGKDSTLSNLVNDEAASITGDEYVGGIAGRNYGTISANDEQLVNRGSITGQMYVGGVAGSNEAGGTITNTISSIALHVKTDAKDVAEGGDLPQYFGGVVGQNSGIIKGATNESSVDVAADGASMVGGIIGENTETGKLEGTIANKGVVSGKSDVGGIIGSNKNNNILNNSAGADRLIVSNSGLVKAEDGGAAGIFYKNTSAINNADLVNTGMVIGGSSKDSVTGGLFGKNSGEISNSTLTNNGTVYGGGTVGGLIGENKGNIFHSSLINSTDGEVIGIQNVGGLIGQNTGDITGGRDENDGYYKYQIYNNGTITVEGNGTNIGGLIGINQTREDGKGGNVTAGYNTGVIKADGSENVGGIAGTNAGTLDQVFNTVITADGQNQTITGGTNVGGIAGTNSGTISNAYNTSDVYGDADSTGSIAGTNSNATDDSISNVYSTITENLVGGTNTTVTNGYNTTTEGNWMKAESYDGFDFNGSKDNAAVWKIYEGSTNPLLKVFHTKLTVDGNTDLELVYNGQDQDIDIGNLLENHITGPTGFADAYNNTKDNNGNSVLLENTNFEHKNAGEYDNWLYSGQIAASNGEDGFNPNNLGYDIDFTQDIDKAQITISLDEIHRNYGSSVIKNGGDYGFTVGNADKDAGLTEEMQEELAGITMNRDFIQDGAVSDLADGKTATNNAGTYEWSAEFSLKDSLANNYELVSEEGTAGSKVTVSENKSIVDKVQLTIDLNDVNRVYGDTAIKKDSYYGIESVTGLVNGDEAQKDSLTLADNADIKDGALSEDKTKTNDVKDGGYSWNVSGEDDAGKAQNFTGIDNLATNYDITINDGSSVVEQKEISVGDLGASIVYGNQDGKGLVIYGDLGLTGIVYNDDVSLSGDASYTTGGSYDTNKGGRDTADVGTYEDSLFVDGLTLTGEKAGNYKLVTNKAVGDIEVRKANLTITVDNAETTYGTAFDSSKFGYTLGGIVNGDTEDALKGDIGNVTYTNSAAKDGANDVWTDNAGTHKGAVGIDRDTLGELSNYEITTVTNGDAVVNRREISIGAGSHDIYVGENEPTYTGTDIQGQLVNGDMISDDAYQYGPETSVDTNVTGEHTIGIHFDGSHLNTSEQSAWDAVMNGLFQNYTVTFTPGKLTISDMPVDMPSEGEHWNFLFDDNPWDRNRDFRERKAEVHFVAGGMTL